MDKGITSRDIKKLTFVFVCEKEFCSDDLITTIDYYTSNGILEKRPRKHALKQNATPTIFKNYPSYLQPQNQPETAKRLDFCAKEHSFIQQAMNESLILSEKARTEEAPGGGRGARTINKVI